MTTLSERAPARAAEGISPLRYLTLDEIMSGKLTLDELLDAPWTHDGRSLRQEFTETLTRPNAVVRNHTIVAENADDFRRQTGSISTCRGGHG